MPPEDTKPEKRKNPGTSTEVEEEQSAVVENAEDGLRRQALTPRDGTATAAIRQEKERIEKDAKVSSLPAVKVPEKTNPSTPSNIHLPKESEFPADDVFSFVEGSKPESKTAQKNLANDHWRITGQELIEKELSPEQAIQIKLMQNDLLTILAAKRTGQGLSPDEIQKEIECERDQLNIEHSERRFGAKTMYLYEESVKFLEDTALPDTIKNLEQLGLMTSYTSPITGERVEGFPSPDWIGLKSKEGKPRFDLYIDPTKPPTEEDLAQLQATMTWIQKANEKILDASYDEALTKLVNEREFPQSWLDWSGSDYERKRERAGELIDVSVRVQEYVKLMHHINQASDGTFPVAVPPHSTISSNADGTVKVALDLPKNLDLQSPDLKKLDDLRVWLEQQNPVLDKIDERMRAAVRWGFPENLMYGEAEEQGVLVPQKTEYGTVARTKDGEIVYQRMPSGEGATGESYNVVTRDCRFSETSDGMIRVEPSATYWDVDILGGRERVGQINFDAKTYKPDEMVAVVINGEQKLIEARELPKIYSEDAQYQDLWKEVGSTVHSIINGAMVLSGGGAVLRAGLGTAEGLLGATRAAAALSSVFDNPGAKQYELLKAINHAREAFFFLDIMHGTFSRGAAVAGQMNAAEEVGHWVFQNPVSSVGLPVWMMSPLAQRGYKFYQGSKPNSVRDAIRLKNDIRERSDLLNEGRGELE